MSSNVDGVELLIDDLATRLVRGEVGSDEEEDAWDMKKHRALGSDSDDDDYDDYVEAVAELLSDDEGSDDGSDSEHGGESKGDDASASAGANDDDDGDNDGDSDQDEADDVGDEDDSDEDEDDGDDDDAADATGAGAGAGAGASKAAAKGPAMTLEEALKIARQRILNRVLTPKDFARIQLLKGKMAEQPSKKRRRGGVDKTEGDDDGVTVRCLRRRQCAACLTPCVRACSVRMLWWRSTWRIWKAAPHANAAAPWSVWKRPRRSSCSGR